MAEKLMSQEEMEGLVQKVWQESQDKIMESVSWAIRNELMLRAQTTARRHADKVLGPMVEEMVQSKMEDIQKTLAVRAENITKRATEMFESRMQYLFQEAFGRVVSEPLANLGSKLSNLMYDSVKQVIEEDQRKRREEAERREFEKKKKLQEPAT